MPNTRSAKKALRSSTKKRQYNLITKSKVKDSLKVLKKAVTENSIEKAQEALSKVFSSMDKAIKSNFISKHTVDRKKARLAKMLASKFNK